MAALKEESEYEEIFKKGTIVEVSSEDEGLRGSWYTATVIRTISRKTHKILVEYHNLMADDEGSKPLREYVDAILVRPIPPREPHLVYSLMDDVDAFHNDGWWEGVVTQVVLDSSSSSSSYFYSVFFRCSREQILFSSSDLRLHREWVRANIWVPPLLHLSSPSSGQRKRSGEDGRKGSQDRVMRDGGERDVRRRSGNTPTKHDGFVKNGSCREERRSSNGSIDDDMVVMKGPDGKLRICSNGMSKEHGSMVNGKPSRRASNHAGKVVCCLKSATESYGKIKDPKRNSSNHADMLIEKPELHPLTYVPCVNVMMDYERRCRGSWLV
ncbi:DUF724 domain-containing protein 3 [Bienertia sinuspersici]